MRTAATLVSFLFCAGPSAAELIRTSTGLQNPAQTITFGEHILPDRAPITTEYADLGVTFLGSIFYRTTVGGPPHVDSMALANFTGSIGRDFSIHFHEPISEAAFALATQSPVSVVIISALRNGQVLDTDITFLSTSDQNNFYGFSGVVFDEIRFAPFDLGGQVVLDNLQMGPVIPEPSSLALLWAGVAALAAYALRRFCIKTIASCLSPSG